MTSTGLRPCGTRHFRRTKLFFSRSAGVGGPSVRQGLLIPAPLFEAGP